MTDKNRQEEFDEMIRRNRAESVLQETLLRSYASTGKTDSVLNNSLFDASGESLSEHEIVLGKTSDGLK